MHYNSIVKKLQKKLSYGGLRTMKQLSKVNGKIFSNDIMLKSPLLFFFLKEGKTSVKRLINKRWEVEACEVTEYHITDVVTLIKKLTCIFGGALLCYLLLVIMIGLAPMPR